MVTEITMQDMMDGQPTADTDLRVVMFYGPTCGPCKATMPHYETASQFFTERNARIKFLKINAWEPVEQANYCRETWKVEGVPHFKVFCKGEQLTERVGGGDEPTMMKFIHDGIDEAFKRFGERI
jgi:thiol-disulfide isomerase/thioredoxin